MLLVFRHLYLPDVRSSDGIDYLLVARNFAAGRGVATSVIQPGLLPLVGWSHTGQAFIIQAPLWPEVLGLWFRITGTSSAGSAQFLDGALFLVTAVLAWWLAYLVSGRVLAGYLALAMILLNPNLIGQALSGTTVSLQAALFGGIFLLLLFRPMWWRAAAVGVLLGLAIVARENTLFLLPGVLVCWYLAYRRQADAKGILGVGDGSAVARLAGMFVLTAGLLGLGAFLEAFRKAVLLGTWDAPFLRNTLLYYTPVGDSGWIFVLNHPSLHIAPVQYLASHPGILLEKIDYSLDVLFMQQTVTALLSMVGVLLPLWLPWLFPTAPAKAFGWALALTLAVQALFGAISTEHFTYFLTFVPAISALMAASAVLLAGRVRALGSAQRRAVGLAAAAGALYLAAPAAANAAYLARGGTIPSGDFAQWSQHEISALSQLIDDNTPKDAIVASGTADLMSWNTGRTILQYSAQPRYRIGDNDMWRTIDHEIHIDYVLFTSLAGETQNSSILPGFEVVRSVDTAGMQAWLFKRS
ncbi:MAG TPA: hypothetical protein VF157_05085 [Chloroflexota bacterium]